MMQSDIDVVVAGTPLCATYGLMLVGQPEEDPPAARTSYVKIPGASGTLDLTEALAGEPTYDDHDITFTLAVNGWPEDRAAALHRLRTNLNGRRRDFELTWDPGWTYSGRFSMREDHVAGGAVVKLTARADPFKRGGSRTYRMDGKCGKTFVIPVGVRSVVPTVQCAQETLVQVLPDGETVHFQAGTWSDASLRLAPGDNLVMVNSTPYSGTTTWVDHGASDGSTTWEPWADARVTWSQMEWSDVVASEDGTRMVLAQYDWEGFAAAWSPGSGTWQPVDGTWTDTAYTGRWVEAEEDFGDTLVYFKFEMEAFS